MISPTRKDFWASLSLLFVTIPICAGIAIASKGDPSEGILSALIASILFGFFSSSPLAVVGPSASLSIFISMASLKLGGGTGVSLAIVLSGCLLLIFSFFNVYRWINLIPRSVIRGMVTGMGLILILKMIPHLLGYDGFSLLESDQFSQSDGRNTVTELIYGWQNFLPGSIIISIFSGAMFIFFGWLTRKKILNAKIPPVLLVVLIGVLINQLFHAFFPSLALSGQHTLEVNSLRIHFSSLEMVVTDWAAVSELALTMTTVIILEGLITLDLFQKLDPNHSRIKIKRELRLLGLTNALMGLLGLLPVMPVLIRSKAAVEFGAKTQWTNIFAGLWMIIALIFYTQFRYIPMASVAAILVMVGVNLISIKDVRYMLTHGKDHWLPFFMTVSVIFFFDLLWGIVAGFIVGLFFSLKSITRRSMVLVNDQDRYLLKFYKDVTFLNKAELRHLLEKVPDDKEVIIDGTGNIFVDSEIEEWLEDFALGCKETGCQVTFLKSRLAVSRLFKENV